MRRRLTAVATALLVIAATACGSDDPPEPTPLPTIVVPTATATPEPPPGPTVIQADIDGRCVDGPVGADLIVSYSISVPPGRVLSRVRLFVDGEEQEDSEALAQQAYARIATIAVEPGTQHDYRVEVEVPTENEPYRFLGTAVCPASGPGA